VKTLANGFAFPDSDVFMVNEISDHGTYQHEQLAEGLAHVREFGCAIDGGAHAGTWSRTMAGRFARVVAFEPSPGHVRSASSQNMRAFGCANVECHQAALGSRRGVRGDDARRGEHASGGTRARGTSQPGRRQAWPVVTLDSLSLDRVGFLKLDVEGSEPWAIDGAAETITRLPAGHPVRAEVAVVEVLRPAEGRRVAAPAARSAISEVAARCLVTSIWTWGPR
jgi:FkbM family methyltransferase